MPKDPDETGRAERSWDRRSYLKLVGGTAGVPTLATAAGTAGGSGGGSTEASDRSRADAEQASFEYEQVYDAVEDLGMDPTGQEPIDDTLDEYLRSNTKLEFPQGEYLVTEYNYEYGNGLHDFAMVAVETGATFLLETPDAVTGSAGAYWLSLGGPGSYNVRYEGFRHDVGGAPEAPRMQILVDDGLVVRDVLHRGVHRGSQGPFLWGVRTADGTGLVENVRAPDGAPSGSGAVGTFVEAETTGDVEFRNCELAGFPNNGLYQSSKSSGTVRVVGGRYRNNNIANVRLAGSGGVVRDCCVRVDEAHSDSSFPTNMRGIWLLGTDATVGNCDVELLVDVASDGAVVVGKSGRSQTVRNSRIRVDADDTAAVYAKPPDSTPAPVTCAGLQVTGDAAHTSGGVAGSAALRAYGRPRSVFDACCVEQTGEDRDGILLQYCSDSDITDCRFDVTGQAVVLSNSGSVTRRRNRTGSADCTLPTCDGTVGTLVDGFEDGDIAEYRFDRGGAGANVVSSPTRRGGRSLELADQAVELTSTEGLDAYPEAGDTFAYWLRAEAGAEDLNVTYGVQGHDDRYFVRVDVANDDLLLFRYENGSAHRLGSDSAGYSLSAGAWYEVVVDWSDRGNHSITLRDEEGARIARVGAADATWTDGGVGYDAYLACGQRAYVDAVGIK